MGGSVGKTVGRAGLAGISGGLSEFGQKNPFGAPINNPLHAPINNAAHALGFNLFGDPLVSGDGSGNNPFNIDPAAIAADQKSINDLGNTQREAALNFSNQDAAQRATNRAALADALTKQGQAVFTQGLPATEETLNAQHLLNGSGLGQEIARQQGNLATNIANEVGVQGANDLNRASDINLGGFQNQQQLQQSALSRGFSLQDFVNQANVAKAIGASAAPQVGNGKGQTGTLLSGLGATAPLVGAVRGFGKGGPAGAVAGAATGGAMQGPF